MVAELSTTIAGSKASGALLRNSMNEAIRACAVSRATDVPGAFSLDAMQAKIAVAPERHGIRLDGSAREPVKILTDG